MTLTRDLFPSNFFFRQYFYLIDRNLKNPPPADVYCENHHVFPKSIFGESKEIIRISFKHHVVLHFLLYRGYQVAYGNSDEKTKSMTYGFHAFKARRLVIEGRGAKMPYDLAKLAFSEEMRDDLRARATGRHHTEETKLKLSEINKNRETISLKTRAKISASCKGKLVSEETKQRQRKPKSEAHRQAFVEANKFRCKQVMCIETGQIFNSIKDAASHADVNRECISCACKGSQLTAADLHWKFIVN